MTSNASLYTQCSQILGKDLDSSQYHELIKEFNTQPDIALENEHISSLRFADTGIELIYSKARKCIYVAVFFVDCPGTRDGTFHQYAGSLLQGVATSDSTHDVQEKLGPPTTSLSLENESTIEYKFADRRLTFFFDATGQQMRLAMLKLLPSKKAARSLPAETGR